MFTQLKRKMLSKNLSKEMAEVLLNRKRMLRGQRTSELKYVKKFIMDYNLPISVEDNISIRQLISVLDIVLEEKFETELGTEIINYLSYESFRKSYIMKPIMNVIKSTDVILSNSITMKKLVNAIDKRVEVLPLEELPVLEYYDVNILIDRQSVAPDNITINNKRYYLMGELIKDMQKVFRSIDVLYREEIFLSETEDKLYNVQ